MPPRDVVTPRWDMWRYSPVMPLKDDETPVSLGEGLTPLQELPKLAREIGVARLWVKDEGLNPTASFKARGMSAAVTRAKALGVSGLVVPTAGNAGAAMTAYGAAAGLPVRVYAPDSTPKAILDTISTLGAQLCLVAGHIGDAGKQARAFALGDALGDRDLPRLLRCLDEEMWEMKFDNAKSEIGLLYGLISKVRALIFLKEMLREKWIQPEGDYNRFKSQLERIPKEKLPEDKRFNPLALNPYILFKALPHARRYASDELVRAMELLLQCNQRLIFSSLDEKLVLQQTLVEIVRGKTPAPAARVS